MHIKLTYQLFTSELTIKCFQAEENLGMVMVFTLVSAVQERLHDISQRIVEERRDAEETKKREADEAEMVSLASHTI